MGKFDRSGGSRFGSDRGDRGDRGGSRFGADRGDRGARAPMEMFKATCADCGKRCEVPFKPTGERPVYCSDCFSNQAGGNSGRPERRSFDRPSFGDRGDRPKFKATCDKCGEECEVPFRPTQGKPVFCSDCFDKGDSRGDRGESRGRGAAPSNDQLTAISAKLDRLLTILAPVAKAMNVEEEVAAPVAKKTSKVKEEKTVEVAEAETAKPKKEKKAAKVKEEKVEKKAVAKKKK